MDTKAKVIKVQKEDMFSCNARARAPPCLDPSKEPATTGTESQRVVYKPGEVQGIGAQTAPLINLGRLLNLGPF
jgi:hypothetical protein